MNSPEPYRWKEGRDPDREKWKPGRSDHADTSIEIPDDRPQPEVAQ